MQFIFDDQTLDTERRELLRGGMPISVEPQVFDLMVYLVQNRDHVVPDDIKALAVPVLAHRLIFASDQLDDLRRQSEQIIRNLLQDIPVPL